MELSNASVRSLLVPVEGDFLIVPNAAVAEILGYTDPQPVPDGAAWMLGMLPWRGQMIPVVSFEALRGGAVPAGGRHSRLLVLHVLSDVTGDLRFYALLTQGFPSLMTIERGNIAPMDEQDQPATKGRVLVAGRPALIPDLEVVETMLSGSLLPS